MSQSNAANRTLSIEKIGLMNGLGELGIRGVERRLAGISAYDGEVESELVKTGYTTTQRAPDDFDSTMHVGVRINLPRTPNGGAIVLFEPESANRAAALMLTDADTDPGGASSELAQSAVTELGAMMTSGFLDTWANAFDVSIDTGSPVFTNDALDSIITRVLRHYERYEEGEYGLYITSRLRLSGSDIIAQIYLFPEIGTFVDILERLTPEVLSI